MKEAMTVFLLFIVFMFLSGVNSCEPVDEPDNETSTTTTIEGPVLPAALGDGEFIKSCLTALGYCLDYVYVGEDELPDDMRAAMENYIVGTECSTEGTVCIKPDEINYVCIYPSREYCLIDGLAERSGCSPEDELFLFERISYYTASFVERYGVTLDRIKKSCEEAWYGEWLQLE